MYHILCRIGGSYFRTWQEHGPQGVNRRRDAVARLTIEPPRLDVPELARIARPQESITFEPGMVLVVQPHILAPDTRRGLQVGSVAVITDQGADALQRYPMEMVLV